MSNAARHPPVSAVRIWARIRQLQARELGEADYAELRAALSELGRILGFDSLVIEPHRITDDLPWRWITDETQTARWRQAWEIATALDTALAPSAAQVPAPPARHRAKRYAGD